MLPNSTNFVYLNLLQWINLLGAGSVVVLWTIGGSGIKPARANSPEARAIPLEASRAELQTDGGELSDQEREASSSAENQAMEQPGTISVTEDTVIQPLPTEIAASPSRRQGDKRIKGVSQPTLSSSLTIPSHPSRIHQIDESSALPGQENDSD